MGGSRVDNRWRGCLVAMLAGIAACASPLPAAAEPGMRVATLDALTPLSARDEIVRRVLSPLGLRAYRREVAEQRLRVAEQTLAAAEERYDLFVPGLPAGERYGLLVFVSPFDGFALPQGWADVLAREGLVLLSARGSGNGQDMLERRVPLALNGYGYAVRHLPIDPERVYIAGFSGGGRTAQLVGVAWPDVFRGILTFAGSDPFGETAVAPPPRELLRLLQTRTRIVQATGTADEVNIAIDSRTRRSMAALCLANVVHVDQPRLGHGLPRAAGFAKALAALQAPGVNPGGRSKCNARLQARIDAELAQVHESTRAGRLERARKRLLDVDAHYGWLAAPGSVEAMQGIEAQEALAGTR